MESELSSGAEQSLRAEHLSALVDGELIGSDVAAACGRWRDDAALRSTWHLYHIIGDTLRSEDLASDGQGDAAFLSSLRARLEQEPVVLAPARSVSRPAAKVASHRWGWMATSALAAGFVAVGGTLLVVRGPAPSAGEQPVGREMASAGAAPAVAPTLARAEAPNAAASVMEVEPAMLVANGTLMRDARLDRYLAAHSQFSGSSVLGVPSTFLRSATLVAPGR